MKSLALFLFLTAALVTFPASADVGSQSITLIRDDGMFVSVEMDCVGVEHPAPIFGNDIRMAERICTDMWPTFNRIVTTLMVSHGFRQSGDEGLSQAARLDIAFQVKLVTNAIGTVFVSAYTPHPGYGFEVRDEFRTQDISTALIPMMTTLYNDARDISRAVGNSRVHFSDADKYDHRDKKMPTGDCKTGYPCYAPTRFLEEVR